MHFEQLSLHFEQSSLQPPHEPPEQPPQLDDPLLPPDGPCEMLPSERHRSSSVMQSVLARNASASSRVVTGSAAHTDPADSTHARTPSMFISARMQSAAAFDAPWFTHVHSAFASANVGSVTA